MRQRRGRSDRLYGHRRHPRHTGRRQYAVYRRGLSGSRAGDRPQIFRDHGCVDEPRSERAEKCYRISISKTFAIVREIDIDLESGFNIITGETGTGKSVVIQAVSMALGGRGSSSLVGKRLRQSPGAADFQPQRKERQLIEEKL